MAAHFFAVASEHEIMDNSIMSRATKERAGQAFTISKEDSLDALIARSQAGDAVAMESIYNRYKTALFNLSYRYCYNQTTAEDLLQEIFIKIFTHLGDVRQTKTFTAWVYRIALNTCFSYLRERRFELNKVVPLADVEGTAHEALDEEQAGDVRKPLEDAIAGLPRKLREIFLLHDVQGFKHDEIGRMLGISTGTSKSQLFKARLRIREYLKNKRAC